MSLANHGFEVHLIVADGKGDENHQGVNIHDVGKPIGRLRRFFKSSKSVLKKALKIEAHIYHFHDPELMRISKHLIKNGKKVIYDAHEDVPRQVLDKAYIPSIVRKPLSRFLERYEDRVVSRLDGIVTVTPRLEKRFLKNNKNVVQIRNYPKIKEFNADSLEASIKENAVCYVGGITKVRGVLNMVEAMKYQSDTKLLLGGTFESEELRNNTLKSDGWKNVSELGFLSRIEVKETLSKSIAGLVVLEPTKSYVDSIPVKMFEYMMAGIAVIASDFQYWRNLIEAEDCALFVDPKKPEEISAAIIKLVDNKELASEMGERGRKAVLEKFNWAIEEKKLIDFYKRLN
jgi:glycosyltransferase involved in cell wall biosynthesis